MKKSYKIILGWVVLLGLLIRVVGITNQNSGFYVDEASLGYNARSIWETGRDEYGQRFPLAFRSFGDYKPPLFVYAAVPLTAAFGEVVGVRLTAAILGTITIWLVAETARKMAGVKAGLISAAAMATLPWQVNLSRHGIEAVLATALLAGVVWLGTNKRYWGGLILLAISTLAYHSTRYISPLLALLLLRPMNKTKKIAAALIWLAVLWVAVQPFANARALGVQQDFSLRNLAAAYIAYLSPRMLVLGDWQVRNNIYGVSNVWLWVVGLFYVGVWRAIKTTGTGLILAVLLLSPLPAAAAIDPFHAIRALVMVVPISILAGIGGEWIFSHSHSRGVKIGMVFLVGFQTLWLSERLLVQNKLTAYDGWIGGYEQLVDKVLELDTTEYAQVVVDTTDEPAIYSLWQVFGRVPTGRKIALPPGVKYYQPVKWQGPESLVLGNGQKVFFKPVYWPEDQKQKNTLYVGSVWRFDPDALERAGAKVLTEVKDPAGNTKWLAVATKE